MNMCKITCRVTKGLLSKLKRFRLSNGLTQKELADEVGITQPQLAQIEAGKRGQQFSEERLKKLHDMGFDGKVTDMINDIQNIVPQILKDKAKEILDNSGSYKSQDLFLRAFLDNFGLGFRVGVNSIGDASIRFYYSGEEIYSVNHKNGCSVSINND